MCNFGKKVIVVDKSDDLITMQCFVRTNGCQRGIRGFSNGFDRIDIQCRLSVPVCLRCRFGRQMAAEESVFLLQQQKMSEGCSAWRQTM